MHSLGGKLPVEGALVVGLMGALSTTLHNAVLSERQVTFVPAHPSGDQQVMTTRMLLLLKSLHTTLKEQFVVLALVIPPPT